MKNLTAIFPLILLSVWALAQGTTNSSDEIEFDGEESIENVWEKGMTYQRLMINDRKPIPHPILREADVVYANRIERVMDTREKQNLVCRWPKNALSNVIFDAAEKGQICAFKNDSFNSVYRADTVKMMLGEKVMTQTTDPINPDGFIDTVIFQAYNLDDIVRWKIIEDWVFDKQSGEMKPRIVGIAPMYNLIIEGQNFGEYPAFFVKWDQARKLLIKEEVFNRHNDGARLSYYDFFEMRLFSSYITKAPNVFDDEIANYEELKDQPLGQQMESNRIKEKLMNWESDLWQY